jgi:hypothetical protein
MNDDHTLIKSNPLLAAEDFNFLKQQGIGFIEKLASENWTEYNTSDPGITILEAVSYAITDLAYRTSFDMKDLLTPGALSRGMWDKIFYTAREILHGNPVTISDWRKLLIDVDGVRNAWIEPSKDYEVPMYVNYKYIHPMPGSECGCEEKDRCVGRLFVGAVEEEVKTVGDYYRQLIDDYSDPKATSEVKEFKVELESILQTFTDSTTVPLKLESKILEIEGLYNVIIEYEEDVVEDKQREKTREGILKTIHAHRNLCEDFLSVNAVDYEDFVAEARVILKENADPDEVLAQIAFAIYGYLTPKVGFYTIDQMMNKGYTVEEIFEGPALQHGFIDTGELEATDIFRDLRLSDLINLITDIEGVDAISHFTILPVDAEQDNGKDVSIYFNRWMAKLRSERKVARFDLRSSKFTFLKKNSVTTYNLDKQGDRRMDRPARRFEDLKAGDQVYKLDGHQIDFPVSVGENMELEDYYPVQYALPMIYGVGEREVLPHSPTDTRTIQAFQLKGYMQFFEQILADYHAQLNHLNDIFSFDENVNATYYTHVLTEINNFRDLISDWDVTKEQTSDQVYDEFSKVIKTLIEPDALFYNRRNTMLNHLLARFDEDLSEYESLTRYVWEGVNEKKLIADKIRLLQDYGKASAERGRGFDYAEAEQMWDTDNISGAERRIGRLLGFENIKRRTLAPRNLIKEKVMIKNVKGEMVQKPIESGGKLIVLKLLNDHDNVLLTSNEIKDGDCCADEFMNLILEQAESSKNYVLHDRIKGIQRGKEQVKTGIFTFDLVDQEGYEIAKSEVFSSADMRSERINEIISLVACINANEGMHLVEHILLRPKLDTVLPYADFTEPKDNVDVRAERVELLKICLDECDLNKGLRDPVETHKYRISVSRIPAEKCYNNEPWVLEVFTTEGNKSLLFQKVTLDKQGNEMAPPFLLTFRRYEALNARLADLRQFGAEPDNYRKIIHTKEADDAGKENSTFSFVILNEDQEVLAQTHFYETLKEAEAERNALVKYFSFQLDLFCGENPCDHNEDPYSFRVTIILPCWGKRFRNRDYRYFVEKTIQTEIPGHIHAQVKWVGISQMQRFEDVYSAWLDEFMPNPFPEYEPVNQLVKVLNNMRECGQCNDECGGRERPQPEIKNNK